MEVPVEWAQVDGSNWIGDDGSIYGSSIIASTDIDGFSNTFTTPGMQILAGTVFGDSTMGELADIMDFSDSCTYDGRFDYSDGFYTGVYDQYSNCDDQGSVIIVLAAEPAEQDYSVIVLVQVVTDADLDALDHILDTFIVVGDLPRS